MKKILWVSRHNPTKKQRNELKEKFKKVEIIKVDTTISKAKEIVGLMEKYDCSEVMAVVPAAIRRELVNKLGVKPLYAEMMKSRRNGKFEYIHLGFNRILQEQKLEAI